MTDDLRALVEQASNLTAVIYQLRKHQQSHQSWLDHYRVDPDHTCGRCTPEVLAGVGDMVEQEAAVHVYDGLIARVTAAQNGLREAHALLATRPVSPSEEPPRWFPIAPPTTSKYAKKSRPSPTRIPWSVAEKAYSIYASQYGRMQSLERLAERGGFYAEELDSLFPGWRDEASEITALRAELTALRQPEPRPVSEQPTVAAKLIGRAVRALHRSGAHEEASAIAQEAIAAGICTPSGPAIVQSAQAVSDSPLCGAVHVLPEAVCTLLVGHQQNHRGPFGNGIVQWPEPAPPVHRDAPEPPLTNEDARKLFDWMETDRREALAKLGKRDAPEPERQPASEPRTVHVYPGDRIVAHHHAGVVEAFPVTFEGEPITAVLDPPAGHTAQEPE